MRQHRKLESCKLKKKTILIWFKVSICKYNQENCLRKKKSNHEDQANNDKLKVNQIKFIKKAKQEIRVKKVEKICLASLPYNDFQTILLKSLQKLFFVYFLLLYILEV